MEENRIDPQPAETPAQPSSMTINQCGSDADLSSVTIDQSRMNTEGLQNEATDEKPVEESAAAAAPRKERAKERGRRRTKGTGGLQLEKTGIWTVRCLINGKRVSKSTGTRDRAEAELFAKKFLAPYVPDDAERTFENIQAAVMTERHLAEIQETNGPGIKIGDVWEAYMASPMRRDTAKTTLAGKQQVFRSFRFFLEKGYPEVTEMKHVTRSHVETYLNILRNGHAATTYNNRLCVLREMFRVLQKKAKMKENPWEGFQLRADDSHTRRELTIDELARLIDVASRMGFEWRTLFAIAMYTGLRLGDCCKLTWGEVDIVKSIIQKVPEKTKKYRKGRPITVPIHKTLADLLMQTPVERRTGYVLPQIGEWAAMGHAGMGRIHHRIGRIFHNAGIVTSVKVEGRQWKAPEASFHSLRHTFVSLSANAGVPLHIVQSIVGHESTAMTRHYYHENLAALQQAVEAIPSISETGNVSAGGVAPPDPTRLYNRLQQKAIGMEDQGPGTGKVVETPQLPPAAVPVPPVQPPAPAPAPAPADASEPKRVQTDAEAPLAGRSAERNAVRREEKLMAVEAANSAAAGMGGWGADGKAAVPQLGSEQKRKRSEWVSGCVRRWSLRKKMSLLDGTTQLVANGGFKFLQQLWDKDVPMLPDEALEALDVYVGACKG